MATKRKSVTQQEKEKMWQLYQELGQFTKVAKKLKRNPGTVSRYVREYEAEIRGASVALNAKMKGGSCCEKETA